MDWANWVRSADSPSAEVRLTREMLRGKVRDLSTISGDLEMLTRQLASPHSSVQVGLLHERMEQLTAQQRRLVKEIAGQCALLEVTARFEALDTRIEALRTRVQGSRDPEELEQLRVEIDPLVDEWAQLFQEIVLTALQSASA